MKQRFLLATLLGFGVLLTPLIAEAGTNNTVVMYFIGGSANESGGEITYPYYFNITGGIPNIATNEYPLLCDTLYSTIEPGESWYAYTLTGNDLNSNTVQHLEFPSAGVTRYLEALYLYSEELKADGPGSGNSDPGGLYNWAVWDLFAGGYPSASLGLTSSQERTVSNYLAAAETMGNDGSLTPSEFKNYVIYTPINKVVGCGPQEFFGEGCPVAIPEPSSLVLCIVGLVTLLDFGRLLLRRKS